MDDNLNRIEEMLPYKGVVGSKEVFNRGPISLDTSKKRKFFDEVQRPGEWYMSDEDSNNNGSSLGNFNNGTSNEGNVNNGTSNEGRSVSGKNYPMDPEASQEGGKKSRKQKKRKSRNQKQKKQKKRKTRKNL